MTSGDYDDYDGGQNDPPEQPWHNRTSTLLGASVAALAVIGIVVLAISFVARQFTEPEPAPLNFVDPTFSATAPRSTTAPATTTQTITSTSPPETTDIGGPTPTASSPTTSGSETTSETTSEPPTTEEDEDEDEETERTTRRTPRTNVTRTLNPFG